MGDEDEVRLWFEVEVEDPDGPSLVRFAAALIGPRPPLRPGILTSSRIECCLLYIPCTYGVRLLDVCSGLVCGMPLSHIPN